MHALLRARMPQRAVTGDTGTPQKPQRYLVTMLRALPLQTIVDIGRHGLALAVHCPTCHTTRSASTDDQVGDIGSLRPLAFAARSTGSKVTHAGVVACRKSGRMSC